MPSNLIQGLRNKGSSCIHVQRMDTCQHEKLLRRTVWFSSAKGQLPDSGVAVAMSELKKPIRVGISKKQNQD